MNRVWKQYLEDAMRQKLSLALLLLVFVLGAINYFRPVPDLEASAAFPTSTTIAGTPPAFPWPSRGSSAVGVSGLGLMATSGTDLPMPMASVAKVMTALVILEDRPFEVGQLGPSILITDADVQAYEADKADQQSVVKVQAGERLTEFQALEALLIPSGNNIASTLARWDAGSLDAFVAKMNQRAQTLGLAHTNFADPAGASPKTVSTPSDLLALGMAAMKLSVFAVISNSAQANLPVAGAVYNVNYVLGQSGIIGIKTGSGLNAGANFLFAAAATIDGHDITLFGCVMGQPTLDYAFNAAKALIATMKSGLRVGRVVTKNEVIGRYDPAWGGGADIISTEDVELIGWPGMALRRTLFARTLVIQKDLPPGTRAGTLQIVLGDYKVDVTVVTAAPLFPPTRFWRLTRIG
jgi:D-alanyl-D-alanine carboxypeptidase (penicillin-binding protein 5/6)